MSGTDVSSDDSAIDSIIQSLKTTAVLGIHSDEARASHYVPAYAKERGVRVLGVNPRFAGEQLFGEEVKAALGDVVLPNSAPVDVVDVFRPSAAIGGHIDEILSMKPLPKVVWLQKGIRNDEAVKPLLEAGIDVVQDRCLLVELRRVLGA